MGRRGERHRQSHGCGRRPTTVNALTNTEAPGGHHRVPCSNGAGRCVPRRMSDGPTVVLLRGIPTNHRLWADVVTHLAPRVRLLTGTPADVSRMPCAVATGGPSPAAANRCAGDRHGAPRRGWRTAAVGRGVVAVPWSLRYAHPVPGAGDHIVIVKIMPYCAVEGGHSWVIRRHLCGVVLSDGAFGHLVRAIVSDLPFTAPGDG